MLYRHRQGCTTDADEKTEEEIRIEIRLAHADPGRMFAMPPFSFDVRTHLANAVYKTTDISLIPSSRSPLLSSPLLVFSLLSLYPAELDGSASGRRCPLPLVHSSMAMCIGCPTSELLWFLIDIADHRAAPYVGYSTHITFHAADGRATSIYR
jgi:hypothetical protein